jgi:hypothetical protein
MWRYHIVHNLEYLRLIMIKRIFFDLDETLIHTTYSIPEHEHIQFNLSGETNQYYTIIRPCANELIKYSRNIVGNDNVFILTAAMKDYALIINRRVNFGFNDDQIFSREDTIKNYYHLAYNGLGCFSNETIADSNNILIDNLPHHQNDLKMKYIGINSKRYLQVKDYYGVNNNEKEFKKQVIEFLTLKNNE